MSMENIDDIYNLAREAASKQDNVGESWLKMSGQVVDRRGLQVRSADDSGDNRVSLGLVQKHGQTRRGICPLTSYFLPAFGFCLSNPHEHSQHFMYSALAAFIIWAIIRI